MTKYIYIDDAPDTASGFAEFLSRDNLFVKLKPAEEWNKTIEYLKSNQSKFDGILLDLQLELPAENVRYDAPALAQQLRNLSKENKFKSLPILLCTTDDNYKNLYDKNTNDNLFDFVYIKGKWGTNVHNQFISFSETYKQIEKTTSIKDLLKIKNTDLINIIEEKITTSRTVHSIASFIFNQLIETTGLLIEEDLLSIRLGIDKNNSNDWIQLLKKLEKFKYKGVFADAWNRWWLGDIMRWWREIADNSSLRTMEASEKVNIIQEEFNLIKLRDIKLPDKHSDKTFWYKCVLSNTPLSSYDAFSVKAQDTKLDWQDRDYISNYHIWTVKKKSQEDEILENVSSKDIETIKIMFRKKREE